MVMSEIGGTVVVTLTGAGAITVRSSTDANAVGSGSIRLTPPAARDLGYALLAAANAVDRAEQRL